MKVKAQPGDSIYLEEASYLVVRQKGASMPYTMMLHVGDELEKKLTVLPGRPLALLYMLIQRLGFDHIAKMTLEEMMTGLEVGRTQASEALRRLKEADLVKKVHKDVYKLNPRYVWRGKSRDRVIAEEQWVMIGVKHE